MVTFKRRGSSIELHQAVNSNVESCRFYRILPCFGAVNLIITSSVSIYRAYANGDIPIIALVAFLCFATFLSYYSLGLCHQIPPWQKSPKKHKLTIGIWVLVSAIMFGFGWRFSKLTSGSASLAFFGVVIGGNFLILHLYSIWDGHKNFRICWISKRKSKRSRYNWRNWSANGSGSGSEIKKGQLPV